jgi:hypothetical protein
MASVDLRDAYYSIPVATEDRKYLMFEWQGSYFQFTCLPNGLSCAPRLFTKILQPVYTHLRMLGHTCRDILMTHCLLPSIIMTVQAILRTQ